MAGPQLAVLYFTKHEIKYKKNWCDQDILFKMPKILIGL